MAEAKNITASLGGVDLSPFTMSIQASADEITWHDFNALLRGASVETGPEGLFVDGAQRTNERNPWLSFPWLAQADHHVRAYQSRLKAQRDAMAADARRAVRECFPDRAEEMIHVLGLD